MSLESPTRPKNRASCEAGQGWVADEAALLERAARLARNERLGHLLRDALIASSRRVLHERSESEYGP